MCVCGGVILCRDAVGVFYSPSQMGCVILRLQRRVTKIIKRVKNYSYRERWREIKITLLERRTRGDLIETFKVINGISNYNRHLRNIPLELEIYCQDRFQKQSLHYWIFFFFLRKSNLFLEQIARSDQK